MLTRFQELDITSNVSPGFESVVFNATFVHTWVKVDQRTCRIQGVARIARQSPDSGAEYDGLSLYPERQQTVLRVVQGFTSWPSG